MLTLGSLSRPCDKDNLFPSTLINIYVDAVNISVDAKVTTEDLRLTGTPYPSDFPVFTTNPGISVSIYDHSGAQII